MSVNVDTAAVAHVVASEGAKNTETVPGDLDMSGVNGTDTLEETFGTTGTAFGGDESLTIEQNGKSVEVDLSGADTFNQVVQRLNQTFEHEGMQVQASFDKSDQDNGLVFTSQKAGEDYEISVTENNFDNGATFGFSTGDTGGTG